jgi:hypothetical protein
MAEAWRTGDMFHTVFGPKTDKPFPEVIAAVHAKDPATRKERACLLAAAPMMAKALERCISALAANGAPNCEAVKEARAALAQSTSGVYRQP